MNRQRKDPSNCDTFNRNYCTVEEDVPPLTRLPQGAAIEAIERLNSLSSFGI